MHASAVTGARRAPSKRADMRLVWPAMKLLPRRLVSVLFVLECVLAKARQSGQAWRRALMTALGPGFTAGFVLLENL